MHTNQQSPNSLPQRLCSEIRLFDLCELDTCGYKSGRFCSNADLVARFEKIADEEISPPQRYIDEELDERDGEDADDYDDYDGSTDEEEYEPDDDE